LGRSFQPYLAMTRLCGHLLSPAQDIFVIRDEPVSQAGVPKSGQTLTIWAGRALACARYTQDPNKERRLGLLDASGSAGVLSRGVGLRGFESHPPHHFRPWRSRIRTDRSVNTIRHFITDRTHSDERIQKSKSTRGKGLFTAKS